MGKRILGIANRMFGIVKGSNIYLIDNVWKLVDEEMELLKQNVASFSSFLNQKFAAIVEALCT